MNTIKLDAKKLSKLPSFNEKLDREYGPKGTMQRETFDAKARAWYYAEVLKDARKAAGITQKQLAERMNCSQQYVSKILKGCENLSLETVAKIELALGITVMQCELAE